METKAKKEKLFNFGFCGNKRKMEITEFLRRLEWQKESEANLILIDGKVDADSLYLVVREEDQVELWASAEPSSYQLTNFWSWD